MHEMMLMRSYISKRYSSTSVLCTTVRRLLENGQRQPKRIFQFVHNGLDFFGRDCHTLRL